VEVPVEIVVTARHAELPDRFRRHATEKLAKVTQLAPRASRLDVEISHETNKRQASACERVELTVLDRGPVIRAEACADDMYGALDLAYAKLLERLRRVRDRRKVHHGRQRPVAVHEATRPLADAALNGNALAGEPGEDVEPQRGEEPGVEAIGDCPVVIREKVHSASPMSLDDALYEMELVGHDFFLFIDKTTSRPSVVYRRRGWAYGVIRLDHAPAEEGALTSPAEPAAAASPP
jgi:ribosomal subunit interface protein